MPLDTPELPLDPLESLEPLEPLEPLDLLEPVEMLELLELLWLLKLLEPLFPMRQGSLGEVTCMGSLQGSEKVPMLLAKVPRKERMVGKGQNSMASPLTSKPLVSHLPL